MKILVAVKRVIDYNVQIRIKTDGSGVETENVKYRIEKPQIGADDAKEDGLSILYTIGAGTSLPIHILNQRSDQQVYASIRKADTPFSQHIRGQQEFFASGFETMYRKK